MPPRNRIPSLAHDLLAIADLYRTVLTMLTRHLLSRRRWPDPRLTASEQRFLGVASPGVISPSRPLSRARSHAVSHR
jgi:hypothetical protein